MSNGSDPGAAALRQAMEDLTGRIQQMQRDAARQPTVHLTSDPDGGVTVMSPMPGVALSGLQAVLMGNTLELSGEVTSGPNPGPFHATVQLPPGLDGTDANMSLENGMLILKLPKTQLKIGYGEGQHQKLTPDHG